jgi:prepilin-type N-terminal cleavage/methylation domain-containing protein/prepilin-type processing-associated H-X9-DG protein
MKNPHLNTAANTPASTCTPQVLAVRPARSPKSAGRKSGFTLIELLVVIAIIVILAAILFPVFGRARENARRASCQSNLKQIGLGIMQYKQDYDERFPPDGIVVDAATVGGWAYTIQPYVKSEQLFQCPSDTAQPAIGATIQDRATAPGFTDYWYNFNLGAGASDASVQSPANVVLNGDGNGASGQSVSDYNRDRPDPNHGSLRHFDGANYGFADGHVKWFKPERVLPGNDPLLCNGGENAPNGSNATFCTF